MSESRQPAPPLGWTEALGEHASNPSTPRTSGDTLQVFGRQWTVSSCEARIKAQFEQWVRRNAKQAIVEADTEDGPEEANRQRSIYQADMGAGHYSWDGRHCRSARGDLPGIRYLLYLLLRRCHPEVTPEQAEAMFRENPSACGMAMAWALGNLPSPAVAGGNGATVMTPVSTTATTTATVTRMNPTTLDSA